MWSIEFYNDTEKEDNGMKKTRSTPDLLSSSQADNITESQDDKTVSSVIDGAQDSSSVPRAAHQTEGSDDKSNVPVAGVRVQRLVSQVSNVSSNKSDDFVFVDHSDARENAARPKGQSSGISFIFFY